VDLRELREKQRPESVSSTLAAASGGVNHRRVHFHPESLLIVTAVLIPNVVLLVLPSKNAAKYDKPDGSLNVITSWYTDWKVVDMAEVVAVRRALLEAGA
jgi:hypothetical protein